MTFSRANTGIVSCFFSLLIAVQPVFGVDSDDLQSKHVAQEKARTLARELVSSVLDIQLRQLKENGLGERPIYKEILGMRKNIDLLVQDDMKIVVDLLVKAQEGSQEQRLKSFNAAREEIRDIVVALMVERQKLFRRLKIARLAAQIREIINLQTEARDVTVSLPEKTENERERFALSALEDQRDVDVMVVQLISLLQEVSQWSGPVGAGASDGLRILSIREVATHLKGAQQDITSAEFISASQHQREVISALVDLLERVEKFRGLISADREAALKMVRDMIEKQEKLRQVTKKTDLNDRNNESLITEQAEIRKELENLAAALERFENTDPLIEQALEAASQATAELFENDQSEAVKEQSKVIGSLAEIEQQLKHGLDLEDGDKSAQELAARVETLEELKDTLENLTDQQDKAEETAQQNPEQAATEERKVADALNELQAKDLPGTLESRVKDAAEAAE
ncbi:MAG: hypothetical protein ACI9HK_004929, partial [Pirellulaceae bacterium]